MTDPIETTENVFERKAREIINWTVSEGTRDFSALLAAIAAALEAERLEERERCAAISDLERDSKIEAAQKFEQGSRERADMYICSVTANSISVLIRNGSA
jgi:hypothetical protein